MSKRIVGVVVVWGSRRGKTAGALAGAWIGLALWTPALAQPTNLGGWSVKLVGRTAWSGIDYVPVCLWRDEKSASFFSAGPWRASVTTAQGASHCNDYLAADLEGRTIYLFFKNFQGGGHLAGTADAYCPDRITAASGPVPYTPCSSSFFDQNGRYRVLNHGRLTEIMAQSGAIPLLEQEVSRLAEKKKADDLAAYRAAFMSATTLEAMREFEARYAGEDSEGLIAEVRDRQRKLQREELARAETAAALAEFLKRYEDDDPANLKREAEHRLTSATAAEATQKKTQQRVETLASLERSIAYCKLSSVAAQQAIRRENRIAQISGYESAAALRQAGSIIARCEEQIPAEYARYRRAGGKKALAAIE